MAALGVFFGRPPCLFLPYAQVYRHRRVSSPAERRQVRWVLDGLCVWALLLMLVSRLWLYLMRLSSNTPVPMVEISSPVHIKLKARLRNTASGEGAGVWAGAANEVIDAWFSMGYQSGWPMPPSVMRRRHNTFVPEVGTVDSERYTAQTPCPGATTYLWQVDTVTLSATAHNCCNQHGGARNASGYVTNHLFFVSSSMLEAPDYISTAVSPKTLKTVTGL